MGPFPGKQFKIQTIATNRSRPSLSVNFNIPFEGLSHGMQVMHRAGFSIKSLNPDSDQVDSGKQTIFSDKPTSNSKKSKPLANNPPSKNSKKSADSEICDTQSPEKKKQRGRRQRRK